MDSATCRRFSRTFCYFETFFFSFFFQVLLCTAKGAGYFYLEAVWLALCSQPPVSVPNCKVALWHPFVFASLEWQPWGTRRWNKHMAAVSVSASFRNLNATHTKAEKDIWLYDSCLWCIFFLPSPKRQIRCNLSKTRQQLLLHHFLFYPYIIYFF